MFLLTWQTIGEAIVAALIWFLEGILGTLQTATRFHTDVPWYQCLISQLIVLGIAIPLVFLGEKARERRREKKRQAERLRNGDF